MSCPYSVNSFCSGLEPELRNMMCAHCHIKRFSKGQWLMRKYWADELALCVDGLLVCGVMDQQQGKFISSGMMSRSYFVSYSDCIFALPEDYLNEFMLCVTDCHIAVFDKAFVRHMYDTNLSFVRDVFSQSLCACSHGTLPMLREVGNGDAYAAVRYVCSFCKHFGIPILTHDQIAMICNRSRPTVTKIMHELTQKEPELFL